MSVNSPVSERRQLLQRPLFVNFIEKRGGTVSRVCRTCTVDNLARGVPESSSISCCNDPLFFRAATSLSYSLPCVCALAGPNAMPCTLITPSFPLRPGRHARDCSRNEKSLHYNLELSYQRLLCCMQKYFLRCSLSISLKVKTHLSSTTTENPNVAHLTEETRTLPSSLFSWILEFRHPPLVPARLARTIQCYEHTHTSVVVQ